MFGPESWDLKKFIVAEYCPKQSACAIQGKLSKIKIFKLGKMTNSYLPYPTKLEKKE